MFPWLRAQYHRTWAAWRCIWFRHGPIVWVLQSAVQLLDAPTCVCSWRGKRITVCRNSRLVLCTTIDYHRHRLPFWPMCLRRAVRLASHQPICRAQYAAPDHHVSSTSPIRLRRSELAPSPVAHCVRWNVWRFWLLLFWSGGRKREREKIWNQKRTIQMSAENESKIATFLPHVLNSPRI